MTSKHEDLVLRLDRVERDLREMAVRASRARGDGAFVAPAERISFRAWMRISGPTLATVVFGFTLLWNAQQATHSQMLESSRSLGRLDGTLVRLDSQIDGLDDCIDSLGAAVGRLEASVAGLAARL